MTLASALQPSYYFCSLNRQHGVSLLWNISEHQYLLDTEWIKNKQKPTTNTTKSIPENTQVLC